MLGVPDRSSRGGRAGLAPLLAVLFAALVATGLDRRAPFPSAEVRRGSEGAFTTGLEPREIEEGVVQRRWAKEALTTRFTHLPQGPLRLEVVLRGHRHEVVVAAGGAVLGLLAPGRSRGEYDLPAPRDGRLAVALRTETFDANGRRLGFMLERIAVRHAPARGVPSFSLVLIFLVPALVIVLLARACSLPDSLAVALAAASSLAQAALLWPEGLVRSPYAARLALLLVLGALGAAFASRWRSPWHAAARMGAGSAFAALLLALWVQGLLATHPMVVTSDAVFHANKVRSAAEGQYFPVSLTPHDPPYRFPYGVSFHLLLVPLYRFGVDPQAAVAALAALASLAASIALLRVPTPGGALRAAVAVALLQLLPVTFGTMSAGNFSNVFAQALTILFLAWDLTARPGGFALGAVLVAFAATAHFGAFLVLLVLGPVLCWTRARGAHDRTHLLAVAVGLLGASAYYLPFLGVMTAQLPRLAEGGAGPRDLFAAALLESRGVLREWGWPALLAASLAAAVTRLGAAREPPSVRALWLTTALLALVALLSPLEVRYLYAGAPALALLAADGLLWLRDRPKGAVAIALLALAQAGLALRGFVHAVLHAYRP